MRRKVRGTKSGSCPVAGFGIVSAELNLAFVQLYRVFHDFRA
jgi:hypothetical protein